MKNLIFGFLFSATMLAACKSENKTTSENNKKDSDTLLNSTAATPTDTPVVSNTGASMSEMVGQYLQIKNALANDNSKDAATGGNAFVVSMGNMEKTNLSPEKVKIWDDLSDDAKEHGEHIGMNGAKLDHQREHFDMLSKDMYDMVKAFGGGQVLYKVFCPMYNNNKGAIWLSETKEIKNPYFGKKMPTCGSVKEELK